MKRCHSPSPARLVIRFLMAALCVAGAVFLRAAGLDDLAPPNAAPKNPTWQEVNAIFGIPLWQAASLWGTPAADVSATLTWPLESKTATTASYRLYPPADYKILGTHPYSVALFAGEDGNVARLSMVFANKGDEKGNYYAAIARDKKTIMGKITAAFGPPAGSRFGDDKEQVKRWDWSAHVFLLSSPSGEYVLLRIVPKEMADAKGVSEKVKPKDLFTALTQRVVKRENGDVVVGEIPMVDQGPKGYCVPATWERYLRYLGFEADMYVLAMEGGTSSLGTNVETMAAFVNSTIQGRGYRMERTSMPLTAVGVSKSIDEGIPLMWSMITIRSVEQEVSARSLQRKSVTDWTGWQGRLKDARRSLRQTSPDEERGSHLCMIIGYNLKTKEIAVSDSWGPAFAERWITEEEAAAINQGGVYCLSKE